MFGKLIPGVGGSAQKDISKDINESVKTLSYLARAEKYFDLELSKDGKITKPLLRIVDVIEPLRKIYVLSQKIEKGTQPEQFEIDALGSSDEIVDVVNDILSLSPKGLVSSDKVVLAKLGGRLSELKRITNTEAPPPATEAPKVKKQRPNSAYSGKLFGQRIAVNEDDDEKDEPTIEIPDSFFEYPPVRANAAPEPQPTESWSPQPEPAMSEPVVHEPAYQPTQTSKPEINDENFWTSDKLDEPLEWDRPSQSAVLDVNEAAVEHTAPEVQEYFESGVHEPAPPPSHTWPQPVQETPIATAPPPQHSPVPETVNTYAHSQPRTYNLPQKYFATSYAGMNLQEAAEIIADLSSNPLNKDIVLMEHASRVKPVELGNEIIGDLLAIAPIADSFETGSEIIDKSHLAVLKNADRIISICHDIANIKVEGFDRRKQKLFDRFLPNDIRKTLELAKISYPEFFSSADLKGEVTTNALLDFSEVILEFAAETGDKLFAELVSQIVVQIALYAEHNDLRLKFDLVTKKNKLNAVTQKLESRSEIAALRSITFVPKIARHAQDILSVNNIADKQETLVEKALEILQLIYMHARDNYSAEMQNFYSYKAS